MAESNSTVTYKEPPEFPGYRVGDDGSIWSRWRTCRWGTILTDRWRGLKPATSRKGYKYLNLTAADGIRRTYRVHRVVLIAFVAPCPDGCEARHLNGRKNDNRPGNLAWGSTKDNAADNHRLGVYQQGEKHHRSKLTEKKVKSMRRLYARGTMLLRELADMFETSMSNVLAVVNRRSWKHVV